LIAIDTNILVYAHRADSQWAHKAKECMREAAEGRSMWAIPWPCIHEFLAIVTHPRIYEPPSTMKQAIGQVDAWMESPSLSIIGEVDKHWSILADQLTAGRTIGPMVHDARVAAICIGSGVSEILTADRDFDRFPQLAARNPLIDSAPPFAGALSRSKQGAE